MTQLSFYPSGLSKPFELSLSAIKSVFEPENPSYSKRQPNCQKCGQHGRKSRLKGHKRLCPFRDCPCPKCQVVSERQKLMADQIKIRRRQRKDSIMNFTRDHIASSINAAAALSAGQMNFAGLGSLNLLYNQLKQQMPSSLLTSPTSSDSSAYSPTNPINPFASSPDLLRTPLLFPHSPPNSGSPPTTGTLSSGGVIAPVAINPVTPSAFPFPLMPPNDCILLQNLLANYKFLEQKVGEPTLDSQMSNAIIDVCSV
uniref:DM domain-containing protein n=1 Tax=Heterorhabditis bacteriophora TaxID=37862 RepID=A0A1I7XLK5_HETBA